MKKMTNRIRRAAIRPSEHGEQAAIIAWARMNEWRIPELALLFSTLNGIPIPASSMTRAKIINRMKAEGMKNGVPDLILLVPHGGYHGLVIELKVGANKPSDEQTWWLDALDKQGYRAVAIWGADECIKLLEDYLCSVPVVVDGKDMIGIMP
jgi:hypothetical protein